MMIFPFPQAEFFLRLFFLSFVSDRAAAGHGVPVLDPSREVLKETRRRVAGGSPIVRA
jgi:hypothetical protein